MNFVRRIKYGVEWGLDYHQGLYTNLVTALSVVAVGFCCLVLLVIAVAATRGLLAPVIPLGAIVYLARKTPPKETK